MTKVRRNAGVPRRSTISPIEEILAESENDDFDPFDQFDQELESAADSAEEEQQEQRQPRLPRVVNIQRRFETEDVHLVQPGDDPNICPYKPNAGGNWGQKKIELRIWEDTPFLIVKKVFHLNQIVEVTNKYLGPSITTDQEWKWCKWKETKKTKTGQGLKLYCSHGGWANVEAKRVRAI